MTAMYAGMNHEMCVGVKQYFAGIVEMKFLQGQMGTDVISCSCSVVLSTTVMNNV